METFSYFRETKQGDMTNKKEQSESKGQKQEKVVVTQEEIDGLKIVFQNAKKNVLDREEDDNLVGMVNFQRNIISKLEKLKNGESS